MATVPRAVAAAAAHITDGSTCPHPKARHSTTVPRSVAAAPPLPPPPPAAPDVPDRLRLPSLPTPLATTAATLTAIAQRNASIRTRAHRQHQCPHDAGRRAATRREAITSLGVPRAAPTYPSLRPPCYRVCVYRLATNRDARRQRARAVADAREAESCRRTTASRGSSANFEQQPRACLRATLCATTTDSTWSRARSHAGPCSRMGLLRAPTGVAADPVAGTNISWRSAAPARRERTRARAVAPRVGAWAIGCRSQDAVAADASVATRQLPTGHARHIDNNWISHGGVQVLVPDHL